MLFQKFIILTAIGCNAYLFFHLLGQGHWIIALAALWVAIRTTQDFADTVKRGMWNDNMTKYEPGKGLFISSSRFGGVKFYSPLFHKGMYITRQNTKMKTNIAGVIR